MHETHRKQHGGNHRLFQLNGKNDLGAVITGAVIHFPANSLWFRHHWRWMTLPEQKRIHLKVIIKQYISWQLGNPRPNIAALHQKVVFISNALLHNRISPLVHTKYTKNQTTSFSQTNQQLWEQDNQLMTFIVCGLSNSSLSIIISRQWENIQFSLSGDSHSSWMYVRIIKVAWLLSRNVEAVRCICTTKQIIEKDCNCH